MRYWFVALSFDGALIAALYMTGVVDVWASFIIGVIGGVLAVCWERAISRQENHR